MKRTDTPRRPDAEAIVTEIEIACNDLDREIGDSAAVPPEALMDVKRTIGRLRGVAVGWRQPDAETKWFKPILKDLGAAFPGVNFTLVASGFHWGMPVIQVEFDGNDVPGKAVDAALSKYRGVIELDLEWTPSSEEVEIIAGLIKKHWSDQ